MCFLHRVGFCFVIQYEILLIGELISTFIFIGVTNIFGLSTVILFFREFLLFGLYYFVYTILIF